MKVVVIEDSDMVADLARVFLREIGGMQVVSVESNFAMLLRPDFWTSEQPDVALIDFNLGGTITGDAIASYLRDNHPAVRRVQWTASKNLVDGPDPSGLYHFVVSKPFDPAALLEALRG